MARTAIHPGEHLAEQLKEIGMTAAELSKALEPYARVETTAKDRQGTGLGLPLSKALTEANRASFSISSDAGQGTAVEIRFPATRVLAE